MDAWDRLNEELEADADEMVTELLWDQTRNGLDIVSWAETTPEARMQFRAVYRYTIAAMQRAYEDGYVKAMEGILQQQMDNRFNTEDN